MAEKIAREIAQTGPLPFARFMELALYCPECGYYETHKDTVGRCGDFYTSVSVGNLFGQLLALQFATWFDELCALDPRPSSLALIEAGAHDGRLARDILVWLREQRPDLFQQLAYAIVEPSTRRQQRQRETLKDYVPRVQWFDSLQALANDTPPAADARPSTLDPRLSPGVHGIIFSNELLDALPVRRFGWDARRRAWFQWGVTVKDGRFTWTPLATIEAQGAGRGPLSPPPDTPSPSDLERGLSKTTPSNLNLPDELLDVLPDGYIVEVNEAAQRWWRQAARVLRRGRLLTLDYGLTAEELFHPERTGGTLCAYHRHHLVEDVLANVGEQDLTAHVNFSAIQAAGEAEGLTTELFTSQAQFLTRIAARIWRTPAAFGEWTASQTRQFQTLTHPEHLGRAFRVLVQARD